MGWPWVWCLVDWYQVVWVFQKGEVRSRKRCLDEVSGGEQRLVPFSVPHMNRSSCFYWMLTDYFMIFSIFSPFRSVIRINCYESNEDESFASLWNPAYRLPA
uniref:Putative secreted peptide n=1 Tax=Anopheles braziliensis TaxID=58242 RepID=A0A2M3ZU61_9DIPT